MFVEMGNNNSSGTNRKVDVNEEEGTRRAFKPGPCRLLLKKRELGNEVAGSRTALRSRALRQACRITSEVRCTRVRRMAVAMAAA